MAADKFGLRIGLEGEKEFKKALADINASFKVLGSEMKLVASQFDKNDKSVEALTSRNAVLNKEIEAQKQKIETLKATLWTISTMRWKTSPKARMKRAKRSRKWATLPKTCASLQQGSYQIWCGRTDTL